MSLDNFRTLQANRIMKDKAKLQSKIVANGGLGVMAGLYEGERRVSAKIITTKFGKAWLLNDNEADLIKLRGKPYLPFGKTSRVLKNLGLSQCDELAPATAVLTNCATNVFSYRIGNEWGLDAVKVGEQNAN